MMEGPWCRFEEKHEPASDIDAAVVGSLKALDPNRPIREADMPRSPVAHPGDVNDPFRKSPVPRQWSSWQAQRVLMCSVSVLAVLASS